METIAHASRPPTRRSSPRAAQRRREHALPPVPVFIAYADIPSARDALRHVGERLRRTRQCGVEPMLWRFDQLDAPRWRDMALADARRAHTVVIAMGESSTLPAATESWLSALAARHTDAPITALAFFGDDETWTISLQRAPATVRAQQHPAPARLAPPQTRLAGVTTKSAARAA